MLRVGLTGGLGSGKSAAAAIFARLGAHVLSADEIGRDLMRPGQEVFEAIVACFGPAMLRPDGELDRSALAGAVFSGGRLGELNAIVHPAVLARQTELAGALEQVDPGAILVVESALLFETEHAGKEGWRSRFDRVVLVMAEAERRLRRYAEAARAAGTQKSDIELVEDARRRMAAQIPDHLKLGQVDFVLENNGSLAELEAAVVPVWGALRAEVASRTTSPGGPEPQ